MAASLVVVGGTASAQQEPPPLALGDSITVAAGPALEAAGYRVDAAVSRTFDDGLDILRAMGPAIPSRVVVNLGTNGGVSAAQCARLTGLVGADRSLALVTVNIPAAPGLARSSNEVLARCALDAGAVLIDWAAQSAADPGALCLDGIHISCGGAGSYVRFVIAAAQLPAAPSPPPPVAAPPPLVAAADAAAEAARREQQVAAEAVRAAQAAAAAERAAMLQRLHRYRTKPPAEVDRASFPENYAFESAWESLTAPLASASN